MGIGKFVLFPDSDLFAFAANGPSKMVLEYYLEKNNDASNTEAALNLFENFCKKGYDSTNR